MAGRKLSRQQIERIRELHENRRQRAHDKAARVAEQLLEGELGVAEAGSVVTHHGATLIVEDADGALIRCVARQNLGALCCGDRVLWQRGRDGGGVVVTVEPRRSLLSRPDYSGRLKPVAANIDQVLVVIAPQPDFNEFLIDRYLAAIELIGNVEAGIIINKIDLLDATSRADVDARLATYARIGYTLLPASTRTAQGLAALRERLATRTSILVGQSGVGKSSLINALLPEREILTQALSAATGHGQHTTTATTRYPLRDGGYLIDSPGVRSFELGEIDSSDLDRGFREFAAWLGHCRFSDCSHTVEPGCALLAAIERGELDARRLSAYRQLRAAIPRR